MSRIAYVNGRYLPHDRAQVHVEDRGYQFSDGVYEVAAVFGGRVIDEEPHLDRLERSLGELRMDLPLPRGALRLVTREVLRRNRVRDGMVYMQVTRGAAARDHPFPEEAEGAVVLTARPVRWPESAAADRGAEVISLPDRRWGRCDVKSVSLLPNVLARQAAREQGAYEAWLVDRQGRVTEGAATNAWIVDDAGRVVTRDLESNILGGITRQTVIRLAREAGLEVAERPFALSEAKAAPEAFLTSTTSFVRAIVRIDGLLHRRRRAGAGDPAAARSLPRLLPRRTRQPPMRPRAVLFDRENTLVASRTFFIPSSAGREESIHFPQAPGARSARLAYAPAARRRGRAGRAAAQPGPAFSFPSGAGRSLRSLGLRALRRAGAVAPAPGRCAARSRSSPGARVPRGVLFRPDRRYSRSRCVPARSAPGARPGTSGAARDREAHDWQSVA